MSDNATKNHHKELIGHHLQDLANIGYLLTERERKILNKYGEWMQALINEKIPPITDEQRKFIMVAKGTKVAVSEFEKTWVNVMNARIKINNEKKIDTNRDVTCASNFTRPFSKPTIHVCPQCGMVDTNCTCARSWY